jgi:tRNA threonylcarbamoyladenosine biosynthesis protein TsaB
LKSYLAGLKNVEDILICPMIDARRMEVYTSLYNINGKQIEPVSAKIITNRSFENYFVNHSILFCGNGSSKCKTVITHPNAFFNGPFKTSARYMFRLAEEKYKKNEFEDVTYFEPFYLKDFIATVPANKIIK